MFRTVLLGLAAWVVISVPVALLLGRYLALGSAYAGLKLAATDSQDRQLPKVA
jgi:hypothetical protein